MVVDALRSSYVYGNTTQMHYLRHLIDSGQAVAYVAHAHAPTVTLPRIKALTAGTVPNFLDLLRNFNSAAVADDNLIDRLAAAGRRLVFFGDDTWQKLFPGRFLREEGTTSFFVQDTVEVDANVTRNVLVELQRDDWDVMILHYLGLDHIGHWQGPASPLMPPKQTEMDDVVRIILRSLAARDRFEAQRNARLRLPPPKPSLLLVCSDHGMTDQGGHGGTTLPESSTVAVFAAASAAALVDEGEVPSHWPRQHENILPPRVQQVDVAPTLALLMGVPIPTGSIGTVLADMLLGAPVPGQRTHSPTSGATAPFLVESTPLRMQHLLRAYQINAAQYENALRNARTLWDAAEDAPATDNMRRLWHKLDAAKGNHRRWLLTDANAERARSAQLGNQTRELYEEFLQGVQLEFLQLLTNSDLSLLIAGTVALLTIGVALLMVTGALASGREPLNDTTLLVFASSAAALAIGAALFTYCSDGASAAGVCQWREYWPALGVALAGFAIAVGSALAAVGVSHERRSLSSAGVFAIVGTALHWLSLSGTSLVEEEHMCWYYLIATIVGVRAVELVAQRDVAWREAVALLACVRLTRVWNQTGTAWNSKTAGGPSIVPRNDIGEWLAAHALPQYVLYAAHCVALLYALWLWRRRYAQNWLASVAALQTALAVLCVFLFRWHSDAVADMCREKTLAKAAYTLLLGAFGISVLQLATGHDSVQQRLRQFFLHTTLAVVTLSTLVQRGHNAALLGLFLVQGWLLHRTLRGNSVAPWLRALVFEWFGIAALYQLGNSNSTATIEISGAYTGFDEFYQVVTGGLVWLIVYTGPFLFFLMHCASALDATSQAGGAVAQSFAVSSTLTSGRAALTAGLFSIYCIALRHHLFVWSVMSPKYLYVVGGTSVVLLQVLVYGALSLILSPPEEKEK
jgi:ethanolaminephosphotransferase